MSPRFPFTRVPQTFYPPFPLLQDSHSSLSHPLPPALQEEETSQYAALAKDGKAAEQKKVTFLGLLSLHLSPLIYLPHFLPASPLLSEIYSSLFLVNLSTT